MSQTFARRSARLVCARNRNAPAASENTKFPRNWHIFHYSDCADVFFICHSVNLFVSIDRWIKFNFKSVICVQHDAQHARNFSNSTHLQNCSTRMFIKKSCLKIESNRHGNRLGHVSSRTRFRNHQISTQQMAHVASLPQQDNRKINENMNSFFNRRSRRDSRRVFFLIKYEKVFNTFLLLKNSNVEWMTTRARLLGVFIALCTFLTESF